MVAQFRERPPARQRGSTGPRGFRIVVVGASQARLSGRRRRTGEMVSVSVNASRESTRTALPGWASHVVLGLIVAIAAYLRFNDLGADSLWRDEIASWEQAQGTLLEVIAATAQDNYPPLHNLVLAASMSLLGDGAVALRLPSAILGVANVFAIYWVSTLIAGRTAGLLSALLLALSGYHVWYSQEARMYALLALAATVYAGSTISFSRSPTAVRGALMLLAGLALLYSHPYGAPTWATIALAVAVTGFWRQEPRGPTLAQWGIPAAATLALFLPWMWVLVGRAATVNETGFWIAYPTPAFILQQLEELATGPVMLGFLAAAGFAATLRESPPPSANGQAPRFAALSIELGAPAVWLLAWGVVPIVLGVLVSVFSTPVFIDRYIIGSLPAFLILAGWGLARFATNWIRLTVVLAITTAVSWLGLVTSSPPPREDWRGVASLFADTFTNDACVVAPKGGGLSTLRYYYREPIDCSYEVDRANPLQPSKIRANLIFVILFGSGDRGASILGAFPSPPWQVGGEVPFTRLNVVGLIRK